ncbi:MAG TPA: BamA/TamA family outer membrane protein [Bryobacteraceae bacterium]|nr:BamA/TamA family outer membrane protein [Bryobacteraceae bacterium]
MSSALKLVALSSLLAFSLASQSLPPDAAEAADLNVNSRYTIESINFVDQHEYKLSTSALDEIRHLVGAKVSTEALDRLAQRIRGELRAHDVTFKLARGLNPESVRVLIQVDHAGGSFNAGVPNLSYNSAVGFTGTGELSSTIGPNAFTFRMLRDSDTLIERLSGVQAKYERALSANGRIRLGFEFDGYEDQYAPSTLAALDAPHSSSLGVGAYGSRLNYEPSATFVLAAPLTLTVGLSFEQLNGLPMAARSESAHAVINSLRYRQRWATSGDSTQELDAGYSLRAATTLLASDLPYTRHVGHLKYNYSSRAQSVEVTVMAGAVYGQAPLFERFSLGDSTLLRGWNKYDLDPLGGNRLVYGSVTYGYHIMRVFYDAGSVWDQGKSPESKDSAGIGVSSGLGVFEKGTFLVALAFPLREGHVTPVVIAGMNF